MQSFLSVPEIGNLGLIFKRPKNKKRELAYILSAFFIFLDVSHADSTNPVINQVNSYINYLNKNASTVENNLKDLELEKNTCETTFDKLVELSSSSENSNIRYLKDSIRREIVESDYNIKQIKTYLSYKTKTDELINKARELNIQLNDQSNKLIKDYVSADIWSEMVRQYWDYIGSIQHIYKDAGGVYKIDRDKLDDEVDQCKDARSFSLNYKNKIQGDLNEFFNDANNKKVAEEQSQIDNHNKTVINSKYHPNSDEPPIEVILSNWTGGEISSIYKTFGAEGTLNPMQISDISIGKRLIAEGNQGIPDGTTIFPIRISYGLSSNTLTAQDILFYKDPFGNWLVADKSLKTRY